MGRLLPLLLALLAGCASAPPPAVTVDAAPWPPDAGACAADLLPLVQRLAAALPPPAPVRLRVVGLGPGLYGLTTQVDGHFEVGIAPDTWQTMVDTLVHEWAHVRSWGADEDPHGPHWGLEYAKAYRAVLAAEEPPADD